MTALAKLYAYDVNRIGRFIGADGRFRTNRTVDGGYVCSRCGVEKPLDARHYRRDRTKRSGFQSRCKKCDNELKQERRDNGLCAT